MKVITDSKNKDYKKVLGAIVCQKLDNLDKMEVSRNSKSTKARSQEN